MSAALEAGVTHFFDCAMGGVGGHPAKVQYGGGHTGNVCTEDWVALLDAMGVRTGIDLDGMLAVAQQCEAVLGRPLHSRVLAQRAEPVAHRIAPPEPPEPPTSRLRRDTSERISARSRSAPPLCSVAAPAAGACVSVSSMGSPQRRVALRPARRARWR